MLWISIVYVTGSEPVLDVLAYCELAFSLTLIFTIINFPRSSIEPVEVNLNMLIGMCARFDCAHFAFESEQQIACMW